MTRRALVGLAVLAFGFSVSGLSRAAVAADGPTGTWKWEVTTQNGDKREVTLKLKAEGEKLTGTVSGRNNTETEIKDGVVKGNDVSFVVEREFNGNKFVMKYKGKVEGDTLKGQTEVERDGQVMTRDFEAKRAS